MLASRNDENAITAQRRVAAGKHHGPRTPPGKSSKTAKRRGHDENASLAPGITAPNKSLAFITPVGKQTRAPLGAKTANAKTFGFRTPAPVEPSQQPPPSHANPTRRAQFKVHTATENDTASEEEREIEYMAPRGVPLPDLPDPDVWPHDRKYPMFEGENVFRGWAEAILGDEEDVDYHAQYRELEQRDEATRQAAAKLAQHRALGGFASATAASAARTGERNLRVSNITVGHSRGRSIAETRRKLGVSKRTEPPASKSDSFSLDELQAFDRYDLNDLLISEGLQDFQLDESAH